MALDKFTGLRFIAALTIAGCAFSSEPPDPATSPPPEPASQPTPATAANPVWTRLQTTDEDVLVVLLRHAIAPGTGDPANFQLGDCSTQRNLSEEGQQQAQAIGQAFRDRNVPVAKVLSSQWCRCLDTAELMDLGPVEEFPPLNSFFRDRSTSEAQTQQVLDYLSAASVESGVIIMVTHQVNITALSGVTPRSGEAVVVEPVGGDVEVVGRVLGE